MEWNRGFDAFNFYQTYGFPKELTEEVLKEQGLEIQNINGFEKASNEHSKISATGKRCSKFR